MGLGIDIYLYFDKKEPIEKIRALSFHKFDPRDGLNLVMTGIDYIEIEDEKRLLNLIEKQLKIDLSLLDYWKHKDEIDIHLLTNTLMELKSKMEANPEFYKNISYGFDIEEGYLRSRLLKDVDYMLQRLTINIENGAKKVKFETE